jgi:hypothetical protein
VTFSLKELVGSYDGFESSLNRGGFVISLSGCVVKLGVSGVERSASMRAFQCTKKRWIPSSGSKVTIV